MKMHDPFCFIGNSYKAKKHISRLFTKIVFADKIIIDYLKKVIGRMTK